MGSLLPPTEWWVAILRRQFSSEMRRHGPKHSIYTPDSANMLGQSVKCQWLQADTTFLVFIRSVCFQRHYLRWELPRWWRLVSMMLNSPPSPQKWSWLLGCTTLIALRLACHAAIAC